MTKRLVYQAEHSKIVTGFEKLSERVDSLSKIMNEFAGRLAKLEGGRNFRDEDIILLMKAAFDDEDDVLCKDLKEGMMTAGASQIGYKRCVTRLKNEGFFRMEKFGVNWAFHRIGGE